MKTTAISHLRDRWFRERGAYVLVDGQFGSTGKGLLAGVLAHAGSGVITHCTTNAGPNSGHTAYLDGHKIVTQQVPVASAFLSLLGYKGVTTLINAGAMVEEDILVREVKAWLDHTRVLVHPNAAMICDDDRTADKLVVAAIAGTGKGTGPALSRKVVRDPSAVVGGAYYPQALEAGRSWDNMWDWLRDTVFVETAQGFSLGINSQFYPNVTSRECSVQQALADARVPAQMLRKVAACYRTFPIRVGNTDNSSGGHYDDQKEISFSDIGQPEEITTVTKRVRRLFTWSREQFRDSVACNRPDAIFINFLNYLPVDQQAEFMDKVVLDYQCVIGRKPETVLVGFGPRTEDVRLWDHDRRAAV